MITPQQKAFLGTLAYSEIGPALLAASDDGYNVLVGSTPSVPRLFANYTTHPRIFNAAMNSDAAGRYQFLGRYWLFYRDMLKLSDFGPASQDLWALQLVRECKALDDIEAGRIADALTKCRSRWASLPGAGYGQRENDLSTLTAAFTAAGGSLA
jgi:muramidase (phage lysozyme)